MPAWERLAIVAGVVLASAVLGGILDRRLARRRLAPEVMTRYRVLRRAITATIVSFGVLSALLVVPQARAIAGGILASSAIVGLIVGFAARSTLSNFVAGLLIALAQPVRIGDVVDVAGASGVVEEIGLTYTFIRGSDESRLVIPNERLASDTIRNSTIVSREQLAEVTVRVPLDADLEAVVALLRDALRDTPDSDVLVSGLEDAVTVTVRARARDAAAAERLGSELRLRAHDRLREAGMLG
jgi:small-conductance mechanosensitive channel